MTICVTDVMIFMQIISDNRYFVHINRNERTNKMIDYPIVRLELRHMKQAGIGSTMTVRRVNDEV